SLHSSVRTEHVTHCTRCVMRVLRNGFLLAFANKPGDGQVGGLPMKTRARPHLPKRPSAHQRRNMKVTEADMAQSSVIGAKSKNGTGHAPAAAHAGVAGRAT